MLESLVITVTRLLTGAVVQNRGFAYDPPVQRIYYANHVSHMDTLLIWSLIPRAQRRRVRPAAAHDYWWASAYRRYIIERVLHGLPVIRHPKHAHQHPLQALEEALAQGESLIFFPEGTRGDGAKLQPFKSGLYHLARKQPAVELVPIYIHNLNRVLPKGEFLPVPILCTVTFGPGFRLKPDETKADFIARAQYRLEALSA